MCPSKVFHQALAALSATSSSEEDEEEGQRYVAGCCEVSPPARAHQRRRGGKNGAAFIFWHQNVADVPLTAGRAHLKSTELCFSFFFPRRYSRELAEAACLPGAHCH